MSSRFLSSFLGASALVPFVFSQAADTYQPQMVPANIAPTPASMPSAQVEVIGQPRMTKGHPCTLWDQEDIDAMKASIDKNEELKASLEKLTGEMDKKIRENLPELAQGGPAPTREDYRRHGANAVAISDLGIAYALTGKEEYGEYAKQLLLAYAKAYKQMPHSEGWTEKKYRSANDGRLTGQFLEDGFWLARAAFGADLVYNVKSWTPEERKQVKDFLEDIASEFYHPVIGPDNYIAANHNRAAICTSAALIAGYATDNEPLVNIALYGVNGTKEAPTGGVFGTHFSDKCIRPDGLWVEGSPAYQMGIASCGLMNDAETLWHHGIDLYRYNNGVLKRLLDSPIALAYPTPKMDVPALHDSGAFAILTDADWLSNESGMPYMYGYLRYRDPAYLPIVRNAHKQVSMTIHAGPPSLFQELPPEKETPKPKAESVNYFAVGYGVLRVPTADSWQQALMEYGPSGSHGHPSKLALDLFAMNDVLSPFPGVIFPYNDPMDPKWYWTTLGNSVLTVDEKSQVYAGKLYTYPRGTPNPEAHIMVFAPANTMGLQRGWSDTLYVEKIPQDRAVFITPQYLVDLYAAGSEQEHKYDLAWHFRGTVETSVKLSPFTFPEPVENGYNALVNPQKGDAGTQAWSATITTPKKQVARFLTAAGPATEVILGDGHYRVAKVDEFPPTLIQRRVAQKNVLFGTAIDWSGAPEPFIKAVQQEGGIEAGYGLLTVQTTAGNDACFVSYRPGTYKAGGLETDAVQAYARRSGDTVEALYLAGHTLKVGSAQIQRSEPGLAYVEKNADGTFTVANPSPTDAIVTVTLPSLAGLTAYELSATGQRGTAATPQASGSGLAFKLKAGGKILLAKS